MGQLDGFDGIPNVGLHLLGRGIVKVGIRVAFGLNGALSVATEDVVLLPLQVDVAVHGAQRNAVGQLVFHVLQLLYAHQHSLYVVGRNVYVQGAPDGNGGNVAYLRAILVAHLHLHNDFLVLVADDAHGHAVGGSQQRIRHVLAIQSAAQGIGLHVVGHDGLALVLPVVLHGVDVCVL